MTTLYRKHAKGIGTWRIGHEGDLISIAHAAVEGGQEVWHTERVTVNASGRSLDEQVQSRIASRIRRQLDRGYTENREEALQGNTNQLGLPLPMLAKKIREVKNQNDEDAALQLKLNGHRCLSTKQDGEIILYSRRGKRINLPHIAEALHPLIPEGTFLDGELYHHGTKLQTIGSWIKKLQPESEKLQYICYDLMSDETFKDRYEELVGIVTPTFPSPVRVLPCIPYVSDAHMAQALAAARAAGYEGLIKRLNTAPYEDGVRSSSLLKVKVMDDCEVTVKKITRSPKGVVVCECLTDDGKRVDVVPPGNVPQKEDVIKFPNRYLERRLTIEYSELTADGVPFHPVAREWREDI